MQTTTVRNTDDLSEATYSLPIDDALIAAHESSLGNNNTWTYRKSRHRKAIKTGRFGKMLGRFWAKFPTTNATYETI